MGILRAAHAPEKVKSVAIEFSMVENGVIHVYVDNFTDDETADGRVPEIKDLMEFALEADRRFSNLRSSNNMRWTLVQLRQLKFIDGVVVLSAGLVHGLGLIEGDNVHHELSRIAHVAQRVFGNSAFFGAARAGGKSQQRWLGRDDSEKRKWREVRLSVFV